MSDKTTMSVDPAVRDKVKQTAKTRGLNYFDFTNKALLAGIKATNPKSKKP